jgi:hypothetical protein
VVWFVTRYWNKTGTFSRTFFQHDSWSRLGMPGGCLGLGEVAGHGAKTKRHDPNHSESIEKRIVALDRLADALFQALIASQGTFERR